MFGFRLRAQDFLLRLGCRVEELGCRAMVSDWGFDSRARDSITPEALYLKSGIPR